MQKLKISAPAEDADKVCIICCSLFNRHGSVHYNTSFLISGYGKYKGVEAKGQRRDKKRIRYV